MAAQPMMPSHSLVTSTQSPSSTHEKQPSQSISAHADGAGPLEPLLEPRAEPVELPVESVPTEAEVVFERPLAVVSLSVVVGGGAMPLVEGSWPAVAVSCPPVAVSGPPVERFAVPPPLVTSLPTSSDGQPQNDSGTVRSTAHLLTVRA